MVAFPARSFFIATLIAAASAGTINFRRNAATIEADIAKISTQVGQGCAEVEAVLTFC
jgi:hypothetical protein